jgi:hypothetical protein
MLQRAGRQGMGVGEERAGVVVLAGWRVEDGPGVPAVPVDSVAE